MASKQFHALTKPDVYATNEQWLQSLLSEKANLLRQVRREVHTRGYGHGSYMDSLERAIAAARKTPE